MRLMRLFSATRPKSADFLITQQLSRRRRWHRGMCLHIDSARPAIAGAEHSRMPCQDQLPRRRIHVWAIASCNWPR